MNDMANELRSVLVAIGVALFCMALLAIARFLA